MGAKDRAARFELAPSSLESVDLAVERDNDVSAGNRHGLLATGRIDQSEPRVEQTSVAAVVLPEAETVGTPMQDGLQHRQGAVRIRTRAGFAGDFSGKPAHSLAHSVRSGKATGELASAVRS